MISESLSAIFWRRVFIYLCRSASLSFKLEMNLSLFWFSTSSSCVFLILAWISKLCFSKLRICSINKVFYSVKVKFCVVKSSLLALIRSRSFCNSATYLPSFCLSYSVLTLFWIYSLFDSPYCSSCYLRGRSCSNSLSWSSLVLSTSCISLCFSVNSSESIFCSLWSIWKFSLVLSNWL